MGITTHVGLKAQYRSHTPPHNNEPQKLRVEKIFRRLVHEFKYMFSIFKQHYTYFFTFFHLHLFLKKLKTVI